MEKSEDTRVRESGDLPRWRKRTGSLLFCLALALFVPSCVLTAGYYFDLPINFYRYPLSRIFLACAFYLIPSVPLAFLGATFEWRRRGVGLGCLAFGLLLIALPLGVNFTD